jgi:excisionase family DNA binding protein
MAKRKALPATSVKASTPEVITFPNQQPEFFTQKEAAVYLRCSYWAIREACYTGDLPCAKLGKSFSIHITDLRAWFEKEKKDKQEAA